MRLRRNRVVLPAIGLLSLTVACSRCSSGTTSGGATGVEEPTPGPDGDLPDGGVRLPDGGVAAVPPADGVFTAGPPGCKPLAVEKGSNLSGYSSDVYTYSDARCTPRAAALVRNDKTDPGGTRGGYLRQLTYKAGDATRTVRGTGVNGWNGFGYVVLHEGEGVARSNEFTGSYRTLLAGKHHAVHEFKVTLMGQVDVTQHWFFATGRSHPIHAITLDSTKAGKDVHAADTRAPYGDIAWDGSADGDTPVEGVGWGDKFKFTTTGNAPVRMSSAWDYTKPNVVPYTEEWSATANAEMGEVSTETFEQHVLGGDYGSGVLSTSCWGKTSSNAPGCAGSGETMPQPYLWPFQLNQYELPFTGNSHRIAWGASYGAVGKSSYTSFGKTLSGFPFTSYSLYIVLGRRTDGEVAKVVVAVERVAKASARAIKGQLVTEAPPGVGRSDAANLAVPGFNPVFATWDVRAEGNAATVDLTSNGEPLDRPILRIFDYAAANPPAHVKVGGKELTADIGYFASVDTAGKTLWLTLNGQLPRTTRVEVF